MDFKLFLNYSSEKSNSNLVIDADNFENDDLRIIYETFLIDNEQKVTVNIIPNHEIVLHSFYLETNHAYKKDDYIFVNGYQSWTDSKEFSINEKLHSLNKLPKVISKGFAFANYGDSFFYRYCDKKGVFHGYSYSYIRNQNDYLLFGTVNDFNAYTIFKFKVRNKVIQIASDINDLNIVKQFTLLDFIIAQGDEKKVFSSYKRNFKEPLIKNDLTGYTSWYNYYQNINENKVMECIQNVHQGDYMLFQIDDGYQTHVGDFLSIDRVKFPHGLTNIVKEIKKKKMLAGIWLAPFVAEKNSQIVHDHPEYFLKDENGNFIVAGSNWSSFYPMDIFNQDVQKYIIKIFDFMIKENHFDLLKLDFLYAIALKPRKDMTRAQVMRYGMDFIREHTKGAQILACGVPLYSCIGDVDYCRIGPDVSLKFDDNWYMKFMHRERISTKLTVQNTIYRRHLDGMWFKNDPDVFLLRKENIKLTEKQKQALAIINHLFGSVQLTSDDISSYDEETKAFFNNLRQYKKEDVEWVHRQSKKILIKLVSSKNVMTYDVNKGEIIYGKI